MGPAMQEADSPLKSQLLMELLQLACLAASLLSTQGMHRAQALPMVQGEARRGQTPVEEQMWLKLHETYLAEVARFQKTVRLTGLCSFQGHLDVYTPALIRVGPALLRPNFLRESAHHRYISGLLEFKCVGDHGSYCQAFAFEGVCCVRRERTWCSMGTPSQVRCGPHFSRASTDIHEISG